AVSDEKHIAYDADDAKWDDRAHHQGGDEKYRAGQGQHVRQRDVGQPNIDQAVDHRVEGEVAWVEAELQQDLLNPQIARHRCNGAIENGARVETVGTVHYRTHVDPRAAAR